MGDCWSYFYQAGEEENTYDSSRNALTRLLDCSITDTMYDISVEKCLVLKFQSEVQGEDGMLLLYDDGTFEVSVDGETEEDDTVLLLYNGKYLLLKYELILLVNEVEATLDLKDKLVSGQKIESEYDGESVKIISLNKLLDGVEFSVFNVVNDDDEFVTDEEEFTDDEDGDSDTDKKER